MPDYSKGKIYKLVNSKTNDVYVGSTTKSLIERLIKHKSKAKTEERRTTRVYKFLNEIGWDNVSIELIEDYPCDSNVELWQREEYWCNQINPSLNSVKWFLGAGAKTLLGINEYDKQRSRKYRELFFDKRIQTCSKYYQANKDIITEKARLKYYANKEANGELIKCPCGHSVKKYNLKRHYRSKKHQQYLDNHPIQFVDD